MFRPQFGWHCPTPTSSPVDIVACETVAWALLQATCISTGFVGRHLDCFQSFGVVFKGEVWQDSVQQHEDPCQLERQSLGSSALEMVFARRMCRKVSPANKRHLMMLQTGQYAPAKILRYAPWQLPGFAD